MKDFLPKDLYLSSEHRKTSIMNHEDKFVKDFLPESVKKDIVEGYTTMIVAEVKKFQENSNFDFLTLFMEAHKGMTEAVETSNYHHGDKFSVYARGKIEESLRKFASVLGN